jgi:hypothetical protein
MSITDVFQRVITALERAGIDYMLAGSFASTRYSSPRSTQDIDIVISASETQLECFIRVVQTNNYYAELDTALEARRRESLFNIIDRDTGWKVDLIFRKSTAFGMEEFRRRQKIVVHGLQMFVATPEDIIIAKLEWAKRGASQRQIEDVAAVLQVQQHALDTRYLEKWIRDLELNKQWDAVRRLAGLAN